MICIVLHIYVLLILLLLLIIVRSYILVSNGSSYGSNGVHDDNRITGKT